MTSTITSDVATGDISLGDAVVCSVVKEKKDGYFVLESDYGIHIGSGNYPCGKVVLTFPAYGQVTSVSLLAYSNNAANTVASVTVGGTALSAPEQVNFTGASRVSAAREYVFTSDVPLDGDVVVTLNDAAKFIGLRRVTIASADASLASPDLSFDVATATAVTGEEFLEPHLANPYDLPVTYSTSNAAVATVKAESGEVVPLSAGVAVITATFPGDDHYRAGKASYVLTVKAGTAAGVVVWAEDFSAAGNYVAPADITTNPVAVYGSDKGGSTMVYADDTYATGEAACAGELLVAKTSGVFSATLALYGAHGDMVLTFACNKNTRLGVSASGGTVGTIQVAGSNPYVYTVPISVAAGTETLTLKFSNTGSSNARVDNFLLSAPQVLLAVGDSGYASMYYETANLLVPAGATLYTYRLEGNELVASCRYAEGDVLPKATACVVEAAEGAYDFVATKTAANADADNQLQGSEAVRTFSGGGSYYQLSRDASDSGRVGFYWGTADGKSLTNAAHKAFLFVEMADGVRGFALPGALTAVRQGLLTPEPAAAYDLQGRRMLPGQRGIRLEAGRKVLVR